MYEPGESLIRDFNWSSANELFTVLQREMIIITTFTIPKLSLLCSFLCSRNPLRPVIKQNARSETNGLLGWHPGLAHEVGPCVHSVRTPKGRGSETKSDNAPTTGGPGNRPM